jgi:hypothetical protein
MDEEIQNCNVATISDNERKGPRGSIQLDFTGDDTPVFWFGSRHLARATDFADTNYWTTIPTGGIVLIEWVRIKDLYGPLGDNRIFLISQNSTIEALSCHLYTDIHEIHARVDDGTYSETFFQDITTNTMEAALEELPGYITSYTYDYAATRNFSIERRHQEMLLKAVYQVVGEEAWLELAANGTQSMTPKMNKAEMF